MREPSESPFGLDPGSLQGMVDDMAELEEEGGQHFWQVTVDTADRTEVEVRLDVTSGTATVEQDDDNDDDS